MPAYPSREQQTLFPALVVTTAVLAVILLAGARLFLLSYTESPDARAQISLAFGAAALAAGLVLFFLFIALYTLVFRPLKTLGEEIRIIAGVNPGYVVELSQRHLLGDIPKAINDLGNALMKSRREMAEAVAASSGDLEGSKARLETILTSLKEGVIVCDERARIVFYNPAAKRVFHDSAAMALGRSLFQLCAPPPIETSLAILRQRRLRNPEGTDGEQDISFVCSTLIGTIISCRIRLLPVMPGLLWSFLLTCEDVSREADARGRRENLLRSVVKGMQTSLTGLSLSADTLEMMPDLDRASREALERSIAEGARSLTGQFAVLSREVEEIESPRYLASDVFTADVVACVARLLEKRGIRLTMTGDPLWVKADIHALLLLLEFLVLRISEFSRASALEAETRMGDRRVHFNFYWPGEAIPEAEIRRWKASLLEPSSVHTVAEVLERLGSEVWSTPHSSPGYSVLHLPMPCSTQQWEPPLPPLPARPVYAEFSSDEDAAEAARLKDLPLNRLTFVAFDTETTGLAPLGGDEIVSIAGVKIVNRGIVVGEIFDMLVSPGRAIPESSVRFHGITDEMVRGKPAIGQALRSFHAFVGDAVLVGHNAAFDMRFMRIKEPSAGVRFRGPVLDTFLLSLYLHGHAPEHSLDAVARRLGVEVQGRHSALGDSLITAQIFIKFLYLLEERGITTLDALTEALRR